MSSVVTLAQLSTYILTKIFLKLLPANVNYLIYNISFNVAYKVLDFVSVNESKQKQEIFSYSNANVGQLFT